MDGGVQSEGGIVELGHTPRTERVLITTAEAAAWLSIGRSKLYELIGTGKITTVRIGRAVRVPVVEVDRFAAELLAEAELAENGRVDANR